MEEKSGDNSIDIMFDGLRGCYIAFEGVDGCGKSTIMNTIAMKLEVNGFDKEKLVLVREPGGTPLAEKIRNMLLDTANSDMPADLELMLFSAARASILDEVILPAITAKEPSLVLSDRCFYSSLVYQNADVTGSGTGLSEEQIRQVTNIATRHVVPNCTYILDIPHKQAAARLDPLGVNHYDKRSLSFKEKARLKYLSYAVNDSNGIDSRVKLIDASQSLSDVVDDVWNDMLFWFGKRLTHLYTQQHNPSREL